MVRHYSKLLPLIVIFALCAGVAARVQHKKWLEPGKSKAIAAALMVDTLQIDSAIMAKLDSLSKRNAQGLADLRLLKELAKRRNGGHYDSRNQQSRP